MHTGKDLKIQRIRLDIKANEVADHLHVHKSYVSKMENGVQPIPEYLYDKWTEFLSLK